jgi:hypothetical protein
VLSAVSAPAVCATVRGLGGLLAVVIGSLVDAVAVVVVIVTRGCFLLVVNVDAPVGCDELAPSATAIRATAAVTTPTNAPATRSRRRRGRAARCWSVAAVASCRAVGVTAVGIVDALVDWLVSESRTCAAV